MASNGWSDPSSSSAAMGARVNTGPPSHAAASYAADSSSSLSAAHAGDGSCGRMSTSSVAETRPSFGARSSPSATTL